MSFSLKRGGGVSVKATGQIEDRDHLTWERRIEQGKRKMYKPRSQRRARRSSKRLISAPEREERVLLPVIAYYGAGRAWLPHRERPKSRSASNGPARRWAAFYDCLNERIRIADLNDWFHREAIAAVNRGGQFRPGFEVVRRAVLRCVPGADRMWFDGDRGEIVLSIEGQAQPFSNLSAGQRMMLALVADIAIKAVTQNNYLVPEERPCRAANGALPDVLAANSWVVLIDELDVHLHPQWQRGSRPISNRPFRRSSSYARRTRPRSSERSPRKRSECSTRRPSAVCPINRMGWTRMRSWKMSWERIRELRMGKKRSRPLRTRWKKAILIRHVRNSNA